MGDGNFREPLFRRPGEWIGIVGRVPLPGEAVLSGGRTRVSGWPTTGSESAFQRIASGYVAFQLHVARVIVEEEVGLHIIHSTT